jgi:hypothetical protein
MAASQLCGSFPADTPEEVFRALADGLGGDLKRIPDGETGDRKGWFSSQLRALLATDGVEMSQATTASGDRQFPQLRFTRPLDELDLSNLGYRSHASDSWAVFQRLRQEGVISDSARFQVCFPTPVAVIGAFVSPEYQADFEPVYEAAVTREVAAILSEVPHDQLAIQWDVAIETAILESSIPHWFGPDSDPFDEVVARLVRLGDLVPEEVELGYHLCYGYHERKHFKEPEDLSLLVRKANAIEERLGRPITWVHMPVPIDRSDSEYFYALKEIQLTNVELYLGVVHSEDGAAGAQKRINAARGVLGGGHFLGVATECGMGQYPSTAIGDLLAIHAAVHT